MHFIGVWDTVESVVLNEGKRWTDARLNPEIAFAYHALAIDERRRDFRPCLWDERNVQPEQTMEQVWFAGVHSDVGGYDPKRGLANISLHWLLDKAESAGMEIDRVSPAERAVQARPARRIAGIVHRILALPRRARSGHSGRLQGPPQRLDPQGQTVQPL